MLQFNQLLYAVINADLATFNFESSIQNSLQSVNQYEELKIISVSNCERF